MKHAFTILLAGLWMPGFTQLIVTSPATDSALVDAITGGGIVYSNISSNGATATSRGLFACPGPCNVGVPAGILLTSGSAAVAAMPNTGTGQGAAINNLSDPQLDNLTTGITRDACVLEFNFIAASDSVRFEYVFASEEYDDYVNSLFNDVFGFFISGPGITGFKNIALVPGTNIAIAINNVNNGGPVLHGVPPPGPCNNCAYYISNTVPPLPVTTAYDGVTTVLTAAAGNLQPGAVYHLKLAISDVGDQIFDSGVFLATGSFHIAGPVILFQNNQPVVSDSLILCNGDSTSLSGPSGFSYLWNTGATTQSITVTQPGVYSLTVTGSNPSAPASSQAVVFVVDTTFIPVPVITQNGNQLISSVNAPFYNYSWTLNGNVIPGANSPLLAFSQPGCYAVTATAASGCGSQSDTLCVTVTGMTEYSLGKSFALWPDPATGQCTILAEGYATGTYSLTVYDAGGRQVLAIHSIQAFPVTFDTSGLPAGIYQVTLGKDHEKTIFTGRLVVRK